MAAGSGPARTSIRPHSLSTVLFIIAIGLIRTVIGTTWTDKIANNRTPAQRELHYGTTSAPPHTGRPSLLDTVVKPTKKRRTTSPSITETSPQTKPLGDTVYSMPSSSPREEASSLSQLHSLLLSSRPHPSVRPDAPPASPSKMQTETDKSSPTQPVDGTEHSRPVSKILRLLSPPFSSRSHLSSRHDSLRMQQSTTPTGADKSSPTPPADGAEPTQLHRHEHLAATSQWPGSRPCGSDADRNPQVQWSGSHPCGNLLTPTKAFADTELCDFRTLTGGHLESDRVGGAPLGLSLDGTCAPPAAAGFITCPPSRGPALPRSPGVWIPWVSCAPHVGGTGASCACLTCTNKSGSCTNTLRIEPQEQVFASPDPPSPPSAVLPQPLFNQSRYWGPCAHIFIPWVLAGATVWVFFALCFIFTHFFSEQTTGRDVNKPHFPTPSRTEDAPAATGRGTTKRGVQRSCGSNDKLARRRPRRATTSVTPAQAQAQARAQHAKAQQARAEYQRHRQHFAQLASERARMQAQAQAPAHAPIAQSGWPQRRKCAFRRSHHAIASAVLLQTSARTMIARRRLRRAVVSTVLLQARARSLLARRRLRDKLA